MKERDVGNFLILADWKGKFDGYLAPTIKNQPLCSNSRMKRNVGGGSVDLVKWSMRSAHLPAGGDLAAPAHATQTLRLVPKEL